MKLRLKRDAQGEVDTAFQAEDYQEARDLREAILAAGATCRLDSTELVIGVIRELTQLGYAEEEIVGQDHEGDVACVLRKEAEIEAAGGAAC